MTFHMDRALQREILELLATKYPELVETQALCAERTGAVQAIAYLAEHGLVEANQSRALNAPTTFFLSKITARGLDFLADDGGLGSVLGVVTVKLHHETLLALLDQKLREAEVPAEERTQLSAALRSLGPKALETLAKELVSNGLNSVPSAVQWLRTTLDQLQAALP